MMKKFSHKPKKSSDPYELRIKRRDFVNGTLVGAGIALLSAKSPLHAAAAATKKSPSLSSMSSEKFDEWNGPGGVGDYAISNGNTRAVREAAHRVRDNKLPNPVKVTDEEYDLVVVGAGFSGLSSAYFYRKYGGKDKKILVLDVDPIPGGVAKLNEFDVDGHKVMAPQASVAFWKPTGLAQRLDLVNEIWYDMGLPSTPEELDKALLRSVPTDAGDVKYCSNQYACTYMTPQDASTGFFLRDSVTSKYVMHKDLINNNFENAPFTDEIKRQLIDAYDRHSPLPYDGDDWLQWLDSMTFQDFLEKQLGYDPFVTKWISDVLAPIGGGLGADVVSAFHAFTHDAPGVKRYTQKFGLTREAFKAGYQPLSFPGGNSLIARHIFKHLLPSGISGGFQMDDILLGNFQFQEFDKQENNIKFRMSSMVSSIEHDGDPSKAERVYVTYINQGKAYKVSGRRVICASGGWVNKHILKDAPDHLQKAFSSYTHAPMMCVNVAVRNTRFILNKGISAAHFDDGFGYYFALRNPLKIGRYEEPRSVDEPAVISFFRSFQKHGSGLSLEQQAVMARAELLNLSYADVEDAIIKQLKELFGDSGFDANRDIAEIVVNRQGHDYIAAPPRHQYSHHGKSGVPDKIRRGYGLVQFAHSELNSIQLWTNACNEGARAAIQSLD